MISVLIVTFKNERHIGACLDSLPWRTASFELRITDNGSGDRTRRTVEESLRGSRRKAVRARWNADNPGYAAAMNRMLSASRGDWICLLGPDTRVRGDALERLADFLKKNPAVGAVAPRLVDGAGKTQASCRRFPTVGDALLEMTGLPRIFPQRFRPRWKMPDFDHASTRSVDQPEATCLMVRRTVLERVGLMDERFPLFFNDVDWCRRIRRRGWDIVFLPSAVVEHVRGASVRRTPVVKIWKSHQGFYRYFMKYRTSVWGRATNPVIGWLLVCTAVFRTTLFMMKPGTDGPQLRRRMISEHGKAIFDRRKIPSKIINR
jgi:N-acetylglucosaminyl-diphospho-decaprenol L-rhamnosyltransferase